MKSDLENWILQRASRILSRMDLTVKNDDVVLVNHLLSMASEIAPILTRKSPTVLGGEIVFLAVYRRKRIGDSEEEVPPEEVMRPFSKWCLEMEGMMYRAGQRIHWTERTLDRLGSTLHKIRTSLTRS
jgi:hypothetical protein